MMTWFIEKDGKLYGPLSSTQLKTMVNSGEITKNNMIRKGKNGNPTPAGEIKGLFKQPDTQPDIISILSVYYNKITNTIDSMSIQTILIIAFVVFMVFISINVLLSISARISSGPEDMSAYLEKERKEIEQEKIEFERQLKEEQLEDIKQEKLLDTQLKLEAQKELLEFEREEKAAKEKEKREEIKYQKIQAKERREKELEKIKEKELTLKVALQIKQEQKNRKDFTAKYLKRMNFNTASIIVPNSFKKHKITIELRGRNYATLVKSQKSKDWLNMLNILTESHFDSFPDANFIEKSLDRYRHYSNKLFILVKTKADFTKNVVLESMCLPMDPDNKEIYPRYYNELFNRPISIGYKLHQDGIGYLFEWDPSGTIIIYPARRNHIDSTVYSHPNKLINNLSKHINMLDNKESLGEINKKELEKLRTISEQQTYNRIILWVKKQ